MSDQYSLIILPEAQNDIRGIIKWYPDGGRHLDSTRDQLGY